MHSMPFSRRLLILFGLLWQESPSKLTTGWYYLIRTFGVTISVVMVAFYARSLVIKDTVLVVSVALIALYSIKGLTYFRMTFKTGHLFRQLSSTFDRLDKQTNKKIESYDKWNMTLTLIFLQLIVTFGAAYIYVVGIGPEIIIVAFASRLQSIPHPAYAVVPIVLFASAVTLFALLMRFYLNVLYVATQTASFIRSKVSQATTRAQPDFMEVRRLLQWYNDLMQAVNEDAGILPFALMALEFTGFAAGITFMVTSASEMNFTPYFIMLTAGSFNVMYLFFAHQFVSLAVEGRKTMEVVWKVAGDAVSDPLSMNTFAVESASHRKALKFFLITETIVPVMAVESIVIDRSLVLSFLSELIPFTVMLFTTMKQLEQLINKAKSVTE